ncbi:RusA family crossover junction endodeoxyribonuclease [Holdemania massiliensis]|uniref:RusA family crossover junction endodeoxyribonuclease n=1 Tax=Holdemania massiliensis TaxID=1468449 RepID=UPI0035636664
MIALRFEVQGEPKAKARPRVTRSGIAYTPKNTILYENLVRTSFQQYYPDHIPIDCEVEAIITAYFSIPKSASQRKKELMNFGLISPTKKPDLDNIAKAVLDSLNGIAYKDDSQIVSMWVVKKYSERPRVEVILKEKE